MSDEDLVEWTVLDKRVDKDGDSGGRLTLVVERMRDGQTIRMDKVVSGATWDPAKVGDRVRLYR